MLSSNPRFRWLSCGLLLVLSVLNRAGVVQAFAPPLSDEDTNTSMPLMLDTASSVGCWSPVGDGLFAAFWDGRILMTSEEGEVRSVAQLPRELTGAPPNIQTSLTVDPLGRTVAIYAGEWFLLDARDLSLLGKWNPGIDPDYSIWTLVDKTLYYQRSTVQRDGTVSLETVKEEAGSPPTVLGSQPGQNMPIAFYPGTNGMLSLSSEGTLTYSHGSSCTLSLDPPIGLTADWMGYGVDSSLSTACVLYDQIGYLSRLVVITPEGQTCHISWRDLGRDVKKNGMVGFRAVDRGAKRACINVDGELYLLDITSGEYTRLELETSPGYVEAQFFDSGHLAVMPQWVGEHFWIRPSSIVRIVDESGATVSTIDLPKLRATTTITPVILP